MKRILLLSAGTNACYHISKTLKEKFSNDFYIVGCDINQVYLIPTAPYLDAFYQVPYSSDPNYYQTVLDICNKEKIDFLIPSFDSDQKLFCPENPDLIKIGVKSFGTSQETLPIYDNKIAMSNFLKKNGFIVPKTYSPDECDANTSYMVKPKNGCGSIGAGIRKGCDIIGHDWSEYIIQECCSEPEVTMECFTFAGKVSTICRERIATKAGVCTKARIFSDSQLESIAKKFIITLKTPHIFNLQFMKNQNGEYAITDVNLRTAGGMSLSYAAGWDEVSALAKIMLGQTDQDIMNTLPTQTPETFVVRAYTDIVTKRK